MEIIEKREFRCQGAYKIPNRLRDLVLRRCLFDSCQHPHKVDPGRRPIVQNVALVRCHVYGSDLGPVVAEDCEIDTIWFHRGIWGPQRIAGCAFKHVVIRGNVTGALTFSPGPSWAVSPSGPAIEDPYVIANRRFYEGVDWALDISEANFTSVGFWSGIPARLIRRDPETQVVLTRSKLLDGRWRAVIPDRMSEIVIEDFLLTGFDDTVYVASRRGRYFREEMVRIDRLRGAGLLDD